MKGASIESDPPHVDITGPEGDIEIEIDAIRGVMYVHVEGFSCLRIYQIKGDVVIRSKELRGRSSEFYVHRVGEKDGDL